MPPEWPGPPMLEHQLLESPWGVTIALAAVAVAMFLIGGRAESRRTQQLAAAPLAAAVLLPILAYSVETDRERMVRNTERLAEAVAGEFDMRTLRQLLTDDAKLLEWDHDQLLRIADNASSEITIVRYYFRDLRVHQVDEGHGRTYVNVAGRVEARQGGGGFTTELLLSWKKTEDGRWLLDSVDRLKIFDKPAESILSRFL